MCTTCGCGAGETRIEGHHMHEHEHADADVHGDRVHTHVHADGTMHSHTHAGPHDHEHTHEHEDVAERDHHHHHTGEAIGSGAGPARAHAPGMSQARMVQIERDILGKNNAFAANNRRFLAEHGIFALNLVSSPGAGKTTLLVETIKALQGMPIAVVEGDQQTSLDADRIRATGVRAVQINTGKGCHLDASQIGHALEHLAPAEDSVLFIENVGNLVCPAAFDLGEAHKVVVLSVTEGEDKPMKYPDMFAASTLLLLNKIDLLPHVNFSVARAIEYARRVRPGIEVLQVSATTGAGMDAWLAWVRRGAEAARERRRDDVARLKRRVAELEARVSARA
jgi:hydrogenase nickel incorporation protein HypB